MNRVPAYRKVTSAMIVLATLFISCGTQPLEPETAGTPVAFDTSLTAAVTKTTSDLPNNTTFGVFAWYQPGVIGGAAGAWSTGGWTPNFMYNQDVTFTTLPSTYTYTPVKYWPNNEENTVTFWAYCPHNASGLTLRESSAGPAYANTSTTGLPYLDFNVLTGRGLVDLMVADFDATVKDQTKHALDTPVHFVFRHLLSRVVFHFVKTQDDDDNYIVRLTDVRIKAIKNTADHPGDNNGGSAEWDNHSNTADLVVYTDDTPTVGDDHLDVPKGDGTDKVVMPLPQALYGIDAAKIHISYVIIPAGGGDPAPEETGEFTIASLHDSWDDSGDGWEKNTQYTYNVSITPGQNIEFSAVISPWSAPVEWVYYHVD